MQNIYKSLLFNHCSSKKKKMLEVILDPLPSNPKVELQPHTAYI